MNSEKHFKWLLYGANGYTGRLICIEAAKKGLKPILAGRNRIEIEALANQYGFDFKIFELDKQDGIENHLEGFDLVLHAAGPFVHTAEKMMDACLATGTHYLDITGEMEVFGMAAKRNMVAQDKNVMLMPGTGFDVVPTDCMAAILKEKMPQAQVLELAFVTLGGQISHGTAMSMTEKLGEGGASRIDGKIIKEPIGKVGKEIMVAGKTFFVMSIPWGDVFTAWFTTGIPNIRTYTGSKPSVYRILKLQELFNPILRADWFKNWMRKKIGQRPAGPSIEKRVKAKAYIWGQVADASGKTATAWFNCPEGYTLTALSSVAIVKKVMAGHFKAGYQTPAGCYGKGLVFELENVSQVQFTG